MPNKTAGEKKTPGSIVIDILSNRKGFDYWWVDVNEENRGEIIAELNAVLAVKDKSAP